MNKIKNRSIILGILSLILAGYSYMEIPFVKLGTDHMTTEIDKIIEKKDCIDEADQKKIKTFLILIKGNDNKSGQAIITLRITAVRGFTAFAIIFFAFAYKLRRSNNAIETDRE